MVQWLRAQLWAEYVRMVLSKEGLLFVGLCMGLGTVKAWSYSKGVHLKKKTIAMEPDCWILPLGSCRPEFTHLSDGVL